MTPKGKKNLFIGLAVTTILGTTGYLIWSMLPKKDKKGKEKDDQDSVDSSVETKVPDTKPTNTGSSNSSSGSSSSSSTKPATQAATNSDLATAYRAWANSTEELKKKYGKTSKYDLDATGSANSFFDKSYAAGKAEYEAYLKSKEKIHYEDLPAILKPVYNNINWNKTLGKNEAGNFYIRLKNSHDQYYYFFDSGVGKVWDIKGKKTLSRFNFANKGKTGTGTEGINKGKLFIKATPQLLAYAFSFDPNQKLSWSDASYTNAVVHIYDAMKGGGTKESKFFIWFNDMTNTQADWSKFYKRFGTKDGENFYQWAKGEFSGSSDKVYRDKMNARMKRIGNSTRW